MGYLIIGIVCGMSIEILMAETELNNDTSNVERFLWVTFWPIFVLIFIFGMKK
jgi:flagellar biosynthesis protein FliQ